MSDDAPKRLVTSADDGLRGLLDAGRRELPSEAQVAALVASVGPSGGGSGGSGGGGRGPGQAPGSASGTGTGTGSGAGTGAATGTLVKAAIAVVLGAGAVVSAVVLTRPAPSPVVESVPIPVAAPVEGTPLAATTPSSEAPSTPTATTAKAAPAPVASAAPADDEVVLLGRAQEALRSDPGLALARCEDHARRHPKGAFVQEREVIAIDALTKLGRHEEAQTRARKFAAAFPNSTHLRRIETILGGTP